MRQHEEKSQWHKTVGDGENARDKKKGKKKSYSCLSEGATRKQKKNISANHNRYRYRHRISEQALFL
jgi:hypothetical protein